MRQLDLDSYVVAGADRSHHAVARLLQHGEALRRAQHLRARQQRPYPEPASIRPAIPRRASGPARRAQRTRRRGSSRRRSTRGSWWPHWLEWIKARSGEMTPAPAALGSEQNPAARRGARPLRHGEIECRSACTRSEGRRCASAIRRGEQGAPAAAALQRDRRQYRAGRAVSRRARWTRGDHLRRARRRRLAGALAAVSPLDAGTAERAAARPVGTRSRWTCSACPGAARSRSNSRSSRASAAGGWCSQPPRPAT